MNREETSFLDVTRPLVSVVIPTRNRLPLLKEALASVGRQSFTGWEIIVVDDCSTDSTWSWLAELTDPRVQAIRLDKRSERSAARNCGMEEARGGFVLFLDDDDRLMPHALQYLTEWATRRPNVVAVVGARRDFDDREHRRRPLHPRWPIKRLNWWRDVVLGWVPGSGQCLLLSAAVRDVGGWDQNLVFAEDYDLWLRLSEMGGAMLVPRVVLECRAHAGQWRPVDTTVVQESLRDGLLERATNQHASAFRMLEARALGDLAFSEHTQGGSWRALILYARGIQAYPAVLGSPIAGPMLRKNIVKAAAGTLLGKRGVKATKHLRALVRILLKRDPGGARRVQSLRVHGESRS